ncbi:hypothetical protein P4O66_009200 [Electrophorus voltai]|uniref:Poly [ADP-ribose] polymerase n=1 Tax=Electrophorus voltai TaxID=2609070 RepID=A0AAD8ZD06_9TELE|nr:hypothetical protein P4O66_009200 [Electrophorus voltai]
MISLALSCIFCSFFSILSVDIQGYLFAQELVHCCATLTSCFAAVTNWLRNFTKPHCYRAHWHCQAASPMFDGKVPHWHHFSCFWLRASVQSSSDISGFSDLRWEDQEKVKKAIESGGATGGKSDQKGAAKGEKTLNDFAVEYAKSNRSTCKGCEQKIEKDQIRVSKKTVDPEKPQLGLIDRWYHTGCFVSRREELAFKPEYSASQLKGFAALRDEDKVELKKRLPAVKGEGQILLMTKKEYTSKSSSCSGYGSPSSIVTVIFSHACTFATQEDALKGLPERFHFVGVEKRVNSRVSMRKDDGGEEEREGHGARWAQQQEAVYHMQRDPADREEEEDEEERRGRLHLPLYLGSALTAGHPATVRRDPPHLALHCSEDLRIDEEHHHQGRQHTYEEVEVHHVGHVDHKHEEAVAGGGRRLVPAHQGHQADEEGQHPGDEDDEQRVAWPHQAVVAEGHKDGHVALRRYGQQAEDGALSQHDEHGQHEQAQKHTPFDVEFSDVILLTLLEKQPLLLSFYHFYSLHPLSLLLYTTFRKRKADSVDGAGVSKKQKKEEELQKQLEMKMKEQSQLIWGIKDKLKKYCSTNDMKELLIANGQEVPSGESNILDRLSDCMAFGSLKPCETCQGQLVFKSDAYYCTGDISAWTKCVFKTQSPNRKDWVTPKEFHEIPFLKKFKFKRQDRVFPKDAPAATVVPAQSAAASAPAASSASSTSSAPTGTPVEVPVDKPLTGLKVLAVGKLSKNKDELKAVVEELGGKITGTVNKAAFCLSSKKEVEKMSKKMEEVRDAGVRVVAEDFLTDIKSSGKALQELISLHGISPWGAEVKVEAQAPPAASKSTGAVTSKSTGRGKEEEAGGSKSKKMKLTVKGGAAVDPDSGLENCAHVLDQNGKIYSATLGLVDIVRGTNSYYKLQLLEDDVQKRYWVFRSWGRVGTTIGGNKLEKFYDKNSAMDNFRNVYEEKTGNSWTSSSFTKYPNKFYPLEIDYGQDEEAVKKLTASTGTKSQLAKPVQELIRMIFDVESMKKAMVEFEIDLQKMPLGKLSKRQIQSAYALLSEVQQAVSDRASESVILDLSNQFYTLIPHDFGMKKPPLLSNLDYIQAKVQMLDNLLDIEVAYSLLRGGTEDNKKDPIDINYEKLKTKIEVVDKSSEEAQVIFQYVKNTHAATHNTYTLEVEEIFKIARDGEYQRYRSFRDLPNCQLLWHGSRTTNYAGILSQGLRIAPPEAPVTGYMFGKGIYFADMVSKSANYCHTSQADPVGLILLGEVALGNMHELKKASHITKLPKGKHSVKGLGRTAPDPSATVSLNGVDVPLGKGINTNIDDTSLLYNEYIVYDVAQVNLKYLLKLRFNYQTSLW